jgi:hypothetical protein
MAASPTFNFALAHDSGVAAASITAILIGLVAMFSACQSPVEQVSNHRNAQMSSVTAVVAPQLVVRGGRSNFVVRPQALTETKTDLQPVRAAAVFEIVPSLAELFPTPDADLSSESFVTLWQLAPWFDGGESGPVP